MNKKHRIALVAHDNFKTKLIDWTGENQQLLGGCELFATGTTGRLIGEKTGLTITCFLSGPYGGDQQIGSRLSEGLIDILIFFWDPLSSMAHDADVRALLRIATLRNIPVASNESTANCILAMLKSQEINASMLIDFSRKQQRALKYTQRNSYYPLTTSAPSLGRLQRLDSGSGYPESLNHSSLSFDQING